jgi:hypothetical protein
VPTAPQPPSNRPPTAQVCTYHYEVRPLQVGAERSGAHQPAEGGGGQMQIEEQGSETDWKLYLVQVRPNTV